MDILEPYDNNKSFTSCIERTSIAIGTSLTWSLVSSCQDSRLSVSSKSSQWTNFLSWGPNQTAIDVKILSIYINDLSSSNILHLGNWHKLWSGRNDCKKTTQLGKISFYWLKLNQEIVILPGQFSACCQCDNSNLTKTENQWRSEYYKTSFTDNSHEDLFYLKCIWIRSNVKLNWIHAVRPFMIK